MNAFLGNDSDDDNRMRIGYMLIYFCEIPLRNSFYTSHEEEEESEIVRNRYSLTKI